MAYIELDASLRVGHEIIDQDHLGLFDAVNTLVETLFSTEAELSPSRKRARADIALATLRSRAEQHFGNEQWIMENAGYPARDSHIQQHEQLLEDLDTFASHFTGQGGDSAAHAVRFLREWLEFHIQAWDRPLAQWLSERDVP